MRRAWILLAAAGCVSSGARVPRGGSEDECWTRVVRLARAGEMGRAREALRRARVECDEDRCAARALIAQSEMDLLGNAPSRARDACERARLAFAAAGDARLESAALRCASRAAALLGDDARAAEAADGAVQLARVAGDRAGEAASTTLAAKLRIDANAPQAAGALLDRAVELARAASDAGAEAEALAESGRLALIEGDVPGAERGFRRAAELAHRDGDVAVEAKALAGLAAALRKLDRFDEAHALGAPARELALSIADPRLQLSVRKTFTWFRPENDAARRWLEALAGRSEAEAMLARAAGDRRAEAAALSVAGNALSHGLWNGEKAIPLYERALDAYVADGDREGEARVLYRLALCHRRAWRHAKALEYYGRAISRQREVGDVLGEAESLKDLGYVYRRVGDPSAAVPLWRRAAELYEQRGDDDERAQMEVNLAELETEEEAFARLTKALGMFRRARNPRGEAYVLQELGRRTAKRGDAADALRRYDAARDLYRQVGNRINEASVLQLIAEVHRDAGDEAAAARCAREAVAIAHAAGARDEEASALMQLASLMADRRPTVAIFHGKQAVNLYQSIRADNRALTADLRVKLARSLSGAYRKLADLLAANGRLGEAQQVLDLLKREEFEQLLHRSKPTSGGRIGMSAPEADAERGYAGALGAITSVGTAYAALSAKPWRTAEEEKRLATLRDEIQQANRTFTAFLAALEKDLAPERGRAVRAQARENRALMKTLRQLGQGTVAVFTVVGERALRVILVTPDVEKGFDVPIGATELGQKILRLVEALKDRTLDPRPAGRELYDALVGPMARELDGAGAKVIMWSLDGPLRYVPVAALWDGERWLAERYASALLTHASQSRLLEAPQRRWAALAVGVTESRGEFAALPGVKDEIRTVVGDGAGHRGIFPGRALLDGDFTRPRLLAALSERRPVVHVASHYVYRQVRVEDDASSEGSYLLLGDGTHLTLAEVDTLPSDLFESVDLLALSACETAASADTGDGAEVDGLAIVAQQKGASAVLATLWKVSDASTPVLMHRFYALRKKGATAAGVVPTSKAHALQRAQIDMAHGKLSAAGFRGARGIVTLDDEQAAEAGKTNATFPGWSHPYHWAPFVLVGNWR